MDTARLAVAAFGQDCSRTFSQERELRTTSFDVFSADVTTLHIGRNLKEKRLYACILRDTAPHDRGAVLDDSVKLTERLARREPDSYIFLVSPGEDPAFRNEFAFGAPRVFVIDGKTLADADALSNVTALNLAIREKLDTGQISAAAFAPYVGKEPAVGSSFFGRTSQIRQILEDNLSYAIIGARMVGKTSMLRELEWRLGQRGEDVIFVDGQSCASLEALDLAICSRLAPSRLDRAIARAQKTGEPLLRAVVKTRVRRGAKRLVLIVDELGTLLTELPATDWEHFGVFRELIQGGELRLFFSCFQELTAKQRESFEGPFINTVTEMRLRMLDETAVQDFFCAPLALVGRHSKVDSIASLAWKETGGHPAFLQLLGLHLFSRLQEKPEADPLAIVMRAVAEDARSVFGSLARELFYDDVSPLDKLVYLDLVSRRGGAGDWAGAKFSRQEVVDALRRHGFLCPLTTADMVLEALEMRGLIVASASAPSLHVLANPLIYRLVVAQDPVGWLLEKLSGETRRNAARCGVDLATPGASTGEVTS